MAYGPSTRMFLAAEPRPTPAPALASASAAWKQLPRDARLAAVDLHLRNA